jgi:hypothetical protein
VRDLGRTYPPLIVSLAWNMSLPMHGPPLHLSLTHEAPCAATVLGRPAK